MKLLSPHAETLCFLYKNKNKNDFSVPELSDIISCNYFMTDNIINELSRTKYITIAKKYIDKNDYNKSWYYKVTLTEKGNVVGENLCRLKETIKNFP